MSNQVEEDVVGVVCLHCGIRTPIWSSACQGDSLRVSRAFRPPVSLVRCRECGKEAPYLAGEIVLLAQRSRIAAAAV
jgi:hypothetical protein